MARWVYIRVRGRVQGVGFRYATLACARQLGGAGWTRNCQDGSVEIVAGGTSMAIEAFLAWCGHGPPGARVESMTAVDREPEADFEGFDIRY